MSDQQTQPAETVNPDAGSHEIIADPELLAACERAVDRTYEAHPYYSARYADRGRRFSSSDSGWLVMVAGAAREEAARQVAWLARVLAGRGMPTVLLEHHLSILAEEVREVGTRDDVAEALAEISAAMRAERHTAIDGAATARLEQEFDATTPGEPGRVERIGLLLVAAVADEARGLRNVVDSLMTWVGDVERFSPEWVAAAGRTVEQARAAVAQR